MEKSFRFIVEKHPEGFIAYPMGIGGIVVGEGTTHDDALTDAKSALQFHIETFGKEVLESDSPILEASIEEANLVFA